MRRTEIKNGPVIRGRGELCTRHPFRDQLAYFFFFVAAFFAGAFFAAFLVAFFIDRVSLTSLRFAIAGSQCDSYINCSRLLSREKCQKT